MGWMMLWVDLVCGHLWGKVVAFNICRDSGEMLVFGSPALVWLEPGVC